MLYFSNLAILIYGAMTYLAVFAFAAIRESFWGMALAVAGIALTYLFQFVQQQVHEFIAEDLKAAPDVAPFTPPGYLMLNIATFVIMALSWSAASLSFFVTLFGV